MKKIIRSFFAIACAIIMFAAPIATVSAASTPTLVMDTEGIKIFRYLPTSYTLSPNQSLLLKDTTTSDGYWKVPAGNKFTFNIALDQDVSNQYYRVLISGKKQGTIWYTEVDSYKYPKFKFSALSYDEEYQFWLVAVSDLAVDSYSGTVEVE